MPIKAAVRLASASQATGCIPGSQVIVIPAQLIERTARLKRNC